jgi:hypothetical protein
MQNYEKNNDLLNSKKNHFLGGKFLETDCNSRKKS